MNYLDSTRQLNEFRGQIAAIRTKMRDVQAKIAPQPVMDYVLATTQGPRPLSSFFGAKRDLIAIHNMGASCPYCTLWADGYNGAYPHLADRAAFLVTSPDAPEAQARFAAGRGWRFPMASHQGTSFAADMGYRGEHGWLPGVSVFRRDGDAIVRVSDARFEPGDAFCSTWHFLDLIPEGADGWGPRFNYGVAEKRA